MRIKSYFVSTLFGLSAMVLGMGTASASGHLTVPTGSVAFNGTMTVFVFGFQGGVCTTNGTADIGSQTSGTVTGINFSGEPACDAAEVVNLPVTMTRPSSTSETITMKNISIETSLIDCGKGDLVGLLTHTHPTTTGIAFNRSISQVGNCEFDGHLDF